jgi:hypothetical protein
MRHRTVFAAVCCVVALCATTAHAVPVEYGIRGGLNVARFDGDLPDAFEEFFGEDLGSRFGAHAGLWVAWPLAPSFAVQAEASWAQKGARSELTAYVPGPVEVEVTYALTYIEVPLLMRFQPAASNVGPRILAGPAIGIPLGGEVRVAAMGDEEEEDLEDLSVEWSVIVGGGISWSFGQTMMGLDLRFQPGLTDIAEDADTRNRVWSVSVSFGWR